MIRYAAVCKATERLKRLDLSSVFVTSVTAGESCNNYEWDIPVGGSTLLLQDVLHSIGVAGR